MQYNENISEALAVLAQIAPQSMGTGTTNSTAINTKLFRRIIAIVNIGTLGSSSAVNAQFVASSTQTGTYTAVSGTLCTNVTTGSTNLVLIELRAETLAAAGAGPWVKLQFNISTAASLVSAEVLGTAGYYPSSDYDLVTPTQVLVA